MFGMIPTSGELWPLRETGWCKEDLGLDVIVEREIDSANFAT